jgi:Leucine-rich repeat (LRR) protein
MQRLWTIQRKTIIQVSYKDRNYLKSIDYSSIVAINNFKTINNRSSSTSIKYTLRQNRINHSLVSIFFLGSLGTNSKFSKADCSKYKTDIDIIDSLPFYVDIKLKDSNENQTNETVVYRTWAEYNTKTEQIENLTLFNEDGKQSINIFCLKHLHTLTLSYIDWPIPSDIQNLKSSLKKLLIIQHQALSTLPSEINQLQSLEYLVLLHTSIRHLPYEIKDLKKLVYLDISYSNLVVLPTFIYQTYPALESLILEQNQLKHLPYNIRRLTDVNLKTLDLSSNRELKTLKGIEAFKNLTSLLVDYCEFKQIPAEIFQLKSLKILSLQHNQLKNISFASLGNLTNLTTLYLSNNEIQNITGYF